MTTSPSTSELNTPGLPDVATLARLANEFFRELPLSEAPQPSLPSAPSAPTGLIPTGLAVPAPVTSGLLAPTGQASPAHGANGLTGHDPRTNTSGRPVLAPAPSAPLHGGPSHGGPSHSAPAASPGRPVLAPAPTTPTPGAVHAPVAGIGAPHNHLPAGVPLAGHAPTGAPSQGGPAVPTVPTVPGIPNEAELRALLAPHGVAAPVLPTAPSSEPSFYFLTQPASPVTTTAVKPVIADPFAVPLRPVHAGQPPFDLNRVRADFPILDEQVNGKRLVWFDNAATTQKPRQVIERISEFYRHENSNIHRAAHALAARASDAYEAARSKVQRFLGASSPDEIIFVRGATEGINLIAHSWGRANLSEGDEIVVSILEHHANIVPWQQVAAATGAVIRVAPVDDDGQIILDAYAKLLGPKTKLVTFTQVSNALGTVTPAKRMVELAHAAGARVLVDGAQAVSHMRVDVKDLGADWYVFSGHKVFGPTGIGAVYGRKELLDATPPWQGGGNMIQDVTFERTLYHPAPARFEAGTGNIADAVGLGAAIDYVTSLGMDVIGQYEHNLLLYATARMREVRGLRPIGTAHDKASVLSFVLDGYSTVEVGKALDEEGIAVRSGHHCAQPILRRFGVEATVRPSLAFYNTCAEVDLMVATLHRLAARKR